MDVPWSIVKIIRLKEARKFMFVNLKIVFRIFKAQKALRKDELKFS